MRLDGKPIFFLGDRAYELVVVDGPIVRDGERYAARFDHERCLLLISRRVPVESRPWLVAVVVGEACLRMWKPIPVGTTKDEF